MKTILLTSAGMRMKNEILKILPKPPEQIKLAHIITASRVVADAPYVDEDKRVMNELGIKFEDIDIAGKNEQELRKILADFDVILVQGGNPFYLIKSIRESGFEKVIKEMIANGKIYIGHSAGTTTAGLTIETSFWKRKKRDTFGVTDLTGMGLVDFNIFVHNEEKYHKFLEEEIPKTKYPVKILNDDQAILIRDEKIIFLDNKSKINN